MICVIEREAKVVWGVGSNESEAMADAKNEVTSKSFKVDESVFEIAQINDSANLNDCGYSLWEHVILPETKLEPSQQALF